MIQKRLWIKSKSFQLAIALIVAGMDFFHLGLVYPLFTEIVIPSSSPMTLGDNSWERALLYAALIGAFPIGQCIGSPIVGKLSDSFGRRRLLFITVAGSAIGMAICAVGVFLLLPWLILCGRLLGGIMGGNLALAYAAIADLSTPQTKMKNLSLIPLTTSIGFILGPLMVGLLEKGGNFTPFEAALPLWIAVVLSILTWALLGFYEDCSTPSSYPDFRSKNRPRLYKEKRLRGPIAAAFLMISANFLLVQYVGPYSINALHTDLSTVSWLYVNLCVSVAIGHLLFTRNLGRLFSSKKILPWSLGTLALSLLALSTTTTLLSLHITLSITMLCCAVAYTNIFAHLSNQAGPHQQGEIMGLGVSVQCLAEWVPPLAVGIFAINIPDLPFLCGAIASLASLFILLTENKKKKKVSDNQIRITLNF